MNKPQRLFYILMFVGLISIPMLAGLWQPDLAVSETEKRELNVMPQWQGFAKSQNFFAGTSDYLNDHFGFREQLVKWNNAALRSLGESPTDKVVLGTGDWVFYKTVDPLTLHTQTDNHALYQERLRDRAGLIQERYAHSKEQGFDYVFTVVPNKMTVYKEYLPSRYAMVDLSVSYHYFVEQLRTKGHSFFFDSFKWLNKAKRIEEKPLFFKNDTHWNPLGAYHEAAGLFDFINQTYGHTIAPKAHEFSYSQTTDGDVSKLLGLMNHLESTEPYSITPSKCTERSLVKLHDVDGIRVSNSVCGNGELTVLLMGDSFMSYLSPYLAEGVGSLYMVKEGIKFDEFKKVVEFTKPDIVIEHKVQRNLPKELFHL